MKNVLEKLKVCQILLYFDVQDDICLKNEFRKFIEKIDKIKFVFSQTYSNN